MSNRSGAAEIMSREEFMCTFVKGRIAKAPDFARTLGEERTAVCRITVVGKACGPASRPPKVALYMKGAEAERCFSGLREGDRIEAAGEIGPERPGVKVQEILVSERVILRERAGGSAVAA